MTKTTKKSVTKATDGDLVKIITQKKSNKEEQGTLMPSPDDNSIIIKLDNGYNIGFEKKEIKKIKLLEKRKESPQITKQKKVNSNKSKKTVTILHCGGTIASRVDYETGAVKAKFSPEELLEMFPELGEVVNLRSKLVANMLSENMRFAHYNIIAKMIEKEVKSDTDGVIITHGTDTLHYTAAALSFMLENLPVPVLLVGAQRSSDRGSSDAFLNLKCAVQFISKTSFCNVAICMHNSAEDDKCAIIPGTKARKMHSSRRDAFKAINSRPFALISPDGKIECQDDKKCETQDTSPKNKKKSFIIKKFKETLRIGLLKAHPQMFVEEIKMYHKFDGLILEGTGLGHFPLETYDTKTKEHELILKEINKLTQKIPLIMTTQTIFGVVNMNVYAPGRKLLAAQVIGNNLNMTPETAYIKLAWLLSNYPKTKIDEYFSKNLRGEISTQTGYEEKFI